MTKYQAYQQPIWFKAVIITLITVIGVVSISLIATYSRLVAVEDKIASAKDAFKEVMIENADLQSQIFETATDESLRELAASRGLVLDGDPAYFEVPQQWLFATQF